MSFHMFSRKLGVCGLIILQLILTGCIIYPTPEHDVMGDLDIDEKKIIIGTTTLEDILIEFGEPVLYLEEKEVFVYKWEAVDGYFMAVFPFLIGGPKWTVHLFLIELDKNHVVKRYENKEIDEKYVDNNLIQRYALGWAAPD